MAKSYLEFLSIVMLCSVVLSCGQTDKAPGKIPNKTWNPLPVTDNTSILGNWSICSFNSNGYHYQLNSCQTVSFTRDGFGSVGQAYSPKSLSWTLANGELRISPVGLSSDLLLNDTVYSTTFDTNTKRSLTIVAKNSKTEYYLSR